jgi:hypothetical protein
MANAILERLLDRLYASLVHGPCLSCRPHHSRQRLDLTGLRALQHLAPDEILPRLLDGEGRCRVAGQNASLARPVGR